MTRAALLAAALFCLAGCADGGAPSNVEKQVAVWKWQESMQDATLDADSARHQIALADHRARVDEAEQRQAAQFAAGVAAQQAASARLGPSMHACVTAGVHRLAQNDTPPPRAAAAVILAECQPSIEAVARTVELAGLSSAGLSHDIAARLWPSLVAGVAAERAMRLPRLAHRSE